jgi:putative oxidoreductase
MADRLAPYAYALMRIVFGAMFFTYGLQKLGFLHGRAAAPLSLLGAAAVLELIVGALIVAGLWVRPAAFLASGEMAYAYFTAHQPRGWFPVENQGIPAVLFCFAFLYMAARGAGPWSLERGGRRSRR